MWLRALCAVALLVGLAGCKKTGSFAIIHVSSVTTLPAVAALRVTADLAGARSQFDVGGGADAGPTFAIPPTRTFGLEIPPNLGGTLTLHIDAYDDANALLLGGDGQIDIGSGQRRDVDVVLGATSTDMAGVADDLGMGTLTLSPPSFVFPLVNEGTSGATTTFTLKNVSAQPSDFISAPAFTGVNQASFKITSENCQGMQLMPQGTCTIMVQFVPKSAGKIAAVLSVSGASSALSANSLGTWKVDTGSQPDLSGAFLTYFSVWGADAANVFAASSTGVWRKMTTGWIQSTNSAMKSVWGTSPTNVFAVGGGPTIMHWTTGGWEDFLGNVNPSVHHICSAVVGLSATEIYAGCDGSNGVIRSGGTATWTDETNSGFSVALWADAATGDVYSLNGMDIRRKHGGTWGPFYTAAAALHAIWGTSASDITAVGDGIIIHYDGASWSTAVGTPNVAYRGIWGTAKDDVFVVGDNGTILHSTGGNTWDPQVSNTGVNLNAIWGSGTGDVYAVGDAGTIMHYQ